MLRYLVFLILSSCFYLLYGAKYAGEFLQLSCDVRSQAMGETGIANSSSIASMLYNPAGIARNTSWQIQTSYSSLYGTLGSPLAYHHYLGLKIPLSYEKAAIGVSWIRFGVDNIPYYPYYEDAIRYFMIEQNLGEPGTEKGKYFSDCEDAFYLTIAKNFSGKFNMGWDYFRIPYVFNIGINTKLINIKLEENSVHGVGFDISSTISMDLRNSFSSDLGSFLNLGLSVTDFNKTGLSWSKKAQDAIPRKLYLAIGFLQELTFWESQIEVNFERLYMDHSFSSRVGAEVSFWQMISLRLGYKNKQLTSGIGLRYNGFTLNYAFWDSRLDYVNKVGLSYEF